MATIMKICPECDGSGCGALVIPGSWYSEPEHAVCGLCLGDGSITKTECDCCGSGPVVGLVDGCAVCERCLRLDVVDTVVETVPITRVA